MSKQPFVAGPSRKPEFWKAVESHKKAEAKKPDPVEAVPVKKAAKKTAKKGRK